MPDPVKGEFTNIGVLLREAARPAAAQLRFTRDWARVRCMDPDADFALLEALESEIAARLPHTATDFKPVLATLEDSLSNTVQISEPRACLAENMATEMDLLMKMYVETLRVKESRRRTGRAALAATMRNEFERAGVWAMMRKRIAASTYTQPGDPMKIDCGYRPNPGTASELDRGGAAGVIRMFHAVSLAGDIEAAKGLAYSAPRLSEGVQRVEGARLHLTAVVEPLGALAGEEGTAEQYRFGVETMESQSIRVLTANDLARAAETARFELGL